MEGDCVSCVLGVCGGVAHWSVDRGCDRSGRVNVADIREEWVPLRAPVCKSVLVALVEMVSGVESGMMAYLAQALAGEHGGQSASSRRK